jgi:hypothetical protein
MEGKHVNRDLQNKSVGRFKRLWASYSIVNANAI